MEPSVPSAPLAADLAGAPVTPSPRPRRLGRPTPRAALTLLAAIVVIAVLALAFSAIRPFILGVVLVYLLAPLVDRLARTGVPRAFAVLLSFVVVIAVVAIVGMLALSPLIRQVQAFIEDLPTILEDARPGLDEFYAGLNLSPEVRNYLDSVINGLAAGAGGVDIGSILTPLVGGVFSVIGAVTAYAILPAWLFFLLKDRTRLADSLEASLPPSWRGDVFAVFAMVDRVFGNWIRGQLLLGVTVGVASFAGLELLAILVNPVFARYAILLALIAGVLELVPFIGPIIAAIPAVLIGLTAGPAGFLAALLLYVLIQQLENNILVPKIQGDAVELHPSAVMFALVVGAGLAGVLGAIVSLPITAAGRDVFKYLFRRVGEPPATVAEALATVSPSLLRSVRPAALGERPSGPSAPADASGASAASAAS